VLGNRRIASILAAVTALLAVWSAVGTEWLFTESLIALFGLLALSLLAPSLGVLAAAVYLPLDLVWFLVSPPTRSASPFGLAGRLLGAYLLWLAVVEIPIAFRKLQRHALLSSFRGFAREIGWIVLSVGAVLALVLLWLEATPLLMRPLFLSAGEQAPTVEAVETLQTNTLWFLVWSAGWAVAATVLYLRRASAAPVGLSSADARVRFVPPRVLLVANGVLLIVLLAGLVTSIFDVALIVAGFVVAEGGRQLLTRYPTYVRLLVRVPPLVRGAAAIIFAAAVGRLLVEAQWRTVAGSEFFPITVAAVTGYVVMRILVPKVEPVVAIPVDYVEPVPRDRSWAVSWGFVVITAGALLIALQSPALADNCSGRSDCFGSARGRAVAAAAGATVAAAAATRRFQVHEEKVFVMAEPRRWARKLGDLQYMDEVEVVGGLENGWYKVKYKGEFGYLPYQALTVGESPNSIARDRKYRKRRGRAVQLGGRD
jgi:hypothetical protein